MPDETESSPPGKKPQALRINIAGQWTVEDMQRQFAAIDYEYNFLLIKDRWETRNIIAYVGNNQPPARPYVDPRFSQAAISYLVRNRWNERLRTAVYTRCEIDKIKYASPGFQDFTGAAKIVELVGKGIAYLIEYRRNKQKHESAMRSEELAADRMEIENQQALVELMKSMGCSQRQIRETVANRGRHRALLSDLIVARKITSIEGPTRKGND
jgi:hypothetical protein